MSHVTVNGGWWTEGLPMPPMAAPIHHHYWHPAPRGCEHEPILDILQRIETKMATQADIDALTAAVTADDSALLTAVTGIQAEIAALKAANPALDVSALAAQVGSLSTAVGAVQALVPPATAS